MHALPGQTVVLLLYGQPGLSKNLISLLTLLRFSPLPGTVASGPESSSRPTCGPECKRCFKKRTHLVEHLHLHLTPVSSAPTARSSSPVRASSRPTCCGNWARRPTAARCATTAPAERNALNRHMASMHEDISNFYSDTYAMSRLPGGVPPQPGPEGAPQEPHCGRRGRATAPPLLPGGLRHTAPDRRPS